MLLKTIDFTDSGLKESTSDMSSTENDCVPLEVISLGALKLSSLSLRYTVILSLSVSVKLEMLIIKFASRRLMVPSVLSTGISNSEPAVPYLAVDVLLSISAFLEHCTISPTWNDPQLAHFPLRLVCPLQEILTFASFIAD